MTRRFFFTLLIVGILAVSCAPLTPTEAPAEPVSEAPGEQPQEEPAAGAPQVFEGFPAEYQDINIPPELFEMIQAGNAEVLQLPEDKSIQKDELYRIVQDDGYLEPYNFDRLAEYAFERRFIAVPERISPDYGDWKDQGVLVGLVYDTASFYATSEQPVYEVYLFDGRAEIRDRFGMPKRVLEAGKEFFWTESPFKPEVLTFFIKNGCWLCWNAGGRCGCLICF